jgi:hypothetical protein
VAAQVDHLERLRADVTVSPWPTVRCTGTGRSAASAAWATVTGAGRLGRRRAARGGGPSAQCVVTTVRRSASPMSARSASGSAAGVDEQCLAARGVAQQVGVVRHLADGELADRQAGQFATSAGPPTSTSPV